MFQRIQDYELHGTTGRWYRPRAYGDPQPNGAWKGWLIFFPLTGGEAIAPPHPETTQPTWPAVVAWAARLTPVYVEGALERALTVTEPSTAISELTAAEYEALAEAEGLERAAEVERANADLDEVAASNARHEVDRIRRDRLAAESARSATEEVAATMEAAMHEEAAREARDTAAVAAQHRRSAERRAASPPTRKKRATKKR
jgi:hypothetical protein